MQVRTRPEIRELTLEPEQDVLVYCYLEKDTPRNPHGIGGGSCRSSNACFSR